MDYVRSAAASVFDGPVYGNCNVIFDVFKYGCAVGREDVITEAMGKMGPAIVPPWESLTSSDLVHSVAPGCNLHWLVFLGEKRALPSTVGVPCSCYIVFCYPFAKFFCFLSIPSVCGYRASGPSGSTA